MVAVSSEQKLSSVTYIFLNNLLILFLHRRLHPGRAHVARVANRVTRLAELGEVLRLEGILHTAQPAAARCLMRF